MVHTFCFETQKQMDFHTRKVWFHEALSRSFVRPEAIAPSISRADGGLAHRKGQDIG